MTSAEVEEEQKQEEEEEEEEDIEGRSIACSQRPPTRRRRRRFNIGRAGLFCMTPLPERRGGDIVHVPLAAVEQRGDPRLLLVARLVATMIQLHARPNRLE
jgi:hypothetical protein